MNINQEFAERANENEKLVMAFDRKSLNPSAEVDKESYYPPIEFGQFLTPDKEQDYLKQYNKGTFTQFINQAIAILAVRYFLPQTLIFQHLLSEDDVILDVRKQRC